MAVHSLGERSYQLVASTIILTCTVVMVFPLIWVVSMSVTSQYELMQRGGFVIIPQRPTFYGYEMLWNRSSIVLQAFLVSVMRTVQNIPGHAHRAGHPAVPGGDHRGRLRGGAAGAAGPEALHRAHLDHYHLPGRNDPHLSILARMESASHTT